MRHEVGGQYEVVPRIQRRRGLVEKTICLLCGCGATVVFALAYASASGIVVCR